MSKAVVSLSICAFVGLPLLACGGPAPSPEQAAARPEGIERVVADGLPATGTLTVEVLGDAVSGNAGALPPDTIETTPLPSVDVYEGNDTSGTLLGQTDPSGSLHVTLALGVHSISVAERTAKNALVFATGLHKVNLTGSSKKLTIHVAPTKTKIVTSYDVGYGNAIYVTGETRYLGDWATAYKAHYDKKTATWDLTKNLPVGAQYKLIEAPWVSGESIAVSSAGVQWAQGSNETVAAPTSGFESVVTVDPTFY